MANCYVDNCGIKTVGQGLCRKHYQRNRRNGNPYDLLKSPNGSVVSEVLLFHGWTVTDSGCWEWNGAKHRQGYGLLRHNGHTLLAHRVSYEHFVGPLGELKACHTCDNPPCINPNHLFAGTQSDNMFDMVKKGRNNIVAKDIRTGRFTNGQAERD